MVVDNWAPFLSVIEMNESQWEVRYVSNVDATSFSLAGTQGAVSI